MNPEENDMEKMTLLIDFTGVGMGMAGVDNTKVSIEVLNILQHHYPEVYYFCLVLDLKNALR